MAAWPRGGTPDRPGAWLTTVARRAALRELRRGARTVLDPAAVEALAAAAAPEPDAAPAIPDAQLELLFACCHPALALDDQVALTLRTAGGLTTAEIARAFLVPEPTLAQRLVRAQRRLRDSGIPFAVPPPERMADRLAAVLGVIYLVFNEGYAASSGTERVRGDLCETAVALARLVAVLLPDEPEALGLAALLLAHDARRPARVDAAGQTVLLEAQDRGLYDAARVREAGGLLDRALAARRPGPYQVQAAIALLHARAARPQDTDWREIAALYGTLARMAPSPMIELNRAAGDRHGGRPPSRIDGARCAAPGARGPSSPARRTGRPAAACRAA
jgi:RNA polymerase sigma-70 factor (ECF subfamily)